jgi:hypothetical protein
MKIYKTQKEVEKDIKDGVLTIKGDVKFECSISIAASIKVIAGDINARNINAWDINAWDINAWDINAWGINAGDINAWDINAWDINAWDINAGNINARNINAWDINAWDIVYYAFCCVYQSIKCFSWKAKREKYKEPICLDGQLEIKTKENEEDKEVLKAIKLLEYKGKLKDGKILTN